MRFQFKGKRKHKDLWIVIIIITILLLYTYYEANFGKKKKITTKRIPIFMFSKCSPSKPDFPFIRPISE